MKARASTSRTERTFGRAVRRRAFTLVELLAVISVITVLIGLTFPALKRMRASAQAVGCLSNLRQLGVALNLYLGEHDQVMPTMAAGRHTKSEDVQVIDTVLATYAGNSEEVFGCPADHHYASESGTSYYWNAALNDQRPGSLNFLMIADNSRIPILSDKEGFHPYATNKVNILYADGHATKDIQFFTIKP